MKTNNSCDSDFPIREAGVRLARAISRQVGHVRTFVAGRDGHVRTDCGGARSGWAFAIVLIMASLVVPAFGQKTHGPVIVGAPVTPGKITIKYEAPTAAPVAAPVQGRTIPEGEPLPTVAPPTVKPIADPVFQKPRRKAATPGEARETTEAVSAAFVNFAGQTSPFSPPDTTGDVGPNHYIQMINASPFQIWNKAGTALTAPVQHGTLFSPAEGNIGDPIVVYDHLADRWVLTQFFSNGMLFAISQTADPTAGTWFTYKFPFTTGFPDYPKIGVWRDAYYMSSYRGSTTGIYAFDRVNMLAGLAAGFVETSISTLTPSAGVRDTRILPADLDGPPPPVGTPGYFVRTVDGQQDTSNPADRIEVFEAVVNWTGPTFSFSLVNTLTPAAFNIMVGNRNGGGIRDMIPMPNSTGTVDGLSNRPMMQLKYRYFGGSPRMVLCQTINIQGSIFGLLGFTPVKEVAGIRWYYLAKAPANWTINQQGTFGDQPPGATTEAELLHRWMGSAAINAAGDIAIGYSIVNDNDASPVFPGIRYTGRLASDPAGTLPQGEGIILNGVNSRGSSLGQRWGDYSQLSVDPSDDTTFWFTTHDANYATRIAAFTVGLREIWVDFNTSAPFLGTFNFPFNTMASGVAAVNSGGKINIKSSSSPETINITKPMRIISVGGASRIGP